MNSIKRDCYRMMQQIASRGRCRYMECQEAATVGHHLFKRDRLGTAFLIDAVVPLCIAHHRFAHEKPMIFKRWAQESIRGYFEMEHLSRKIIRLRKDDLISIRSALSKLANGG